MNWSRMPSTRGGQDGEQDVVQGENPGLEDDLTGEDVPEGVLVGVSGN